MKESWIQCVWIIEIWTYVIVLEEITEKNSSSMGG
jgi:hypothetical protein